MDDLLKKRARISPQKKDLKNPQKTPIVNRKLRIKDAEKISYNVNGKKIRGKLTTGKKVGLSFLIVICVVFSVLYLPPLFHSDGTDADQAVLSMNRAAIKEYKTYLKNNPDADFDGDGLSNALEDEYKTEVWNVDTDADGISDYAELYVTETSPVDSSTILLDEVRDSDEKEGRTLDTPYKIDDVIFWPDDYQSKAYGAMVRTLHGYRFFNYKGWVRFPGNISAYGYRDGVHYELKYRKAEDAYKIESTDEVRIYENPLDIVYQAEFPFAGKVQLEESFWTKMMDVVFPEKGGFFNCRKVTSADLMEKEEDVTAQLETPLINLSDDARFGKNNNTLKDLSWLRKMIESGKCVAASLYSDNIGEAVAVLYGYTADGSLLVADKDLNPVGRLTILECSQKYMDKEGTIGQRSWYEFEGLGFDSGKGDRISFFDYSQDTSDPADDTASAETEQEELTDGHEEQTGETEQPETQTETQAEAQAETQTEAQTEPQSDPQTEAQTETQAVEAETAAPEGQGDSGDTVITFGF